MTVLKVAHYQRAAWLDRCCERGVWGLDSKVETFDETAEKVPVRKIIRWSTRPDFGTTNTSRGCPCPNKPHRLADASVEPGQKRLAVILFEVVQY